MNDFFFVIEKGILSFTFYLSNHSINEQSVGFTAVRLTLNLMEMMAGKGKKEKENSNGWHCATVNGFFHASL